MCKFSPKSREDMHAPTSATSPVKQETRSTATKEHKHAKLKGGVDYLGNRDRDPRKRKRKRKIKSRERSGDRDNYQGRREWKQVKKSSIGGIVVRERRSCVRRCRYFLCECLWVCALVVRAKG
ncbi:hypothetical protein SAY87_022549 [Trapa incisa]|uniref:Uncharacterized protein n=1 Tax=Trapa incisa TaxID=236973 RepID=A0AAN7K153_9MYRT|nr:hypothetical protein SAY87_022549 [Trapa incisa]